MTQVSKYPIADNLYQRISDLMLRVIVDAHSKEDAVSLLQDLLTPTERIMIAKRLATAVLLSRQLTYREIKDVLHVSTPTINHVSSALKYGAKGYTKFVQKTLKEEKSKEFWSKINKLFLKTLGKTNKGRLYRYLHDEMKNDKSTTYI